MAHIRRRVAASLVVGAALALGACATNPQGPTHVTRFHLGQPIAPGEVVIEPRDPALAASPEFQTYAAPVARELTRLGFRVVPAAPRSELVAVVDVQRGSRLGPPKSPPVSIGFGIGGASFGRHSGFGGGTGVGFPVGGTRPTDLVGTGLAVQLKRRSDGTVIWEGNAGTEARAGTPYADPAPAVDKLATALFAGFPGQSGRTITVK